MSDVIADAKNAPAHPAGKHGGLTVRDYMATHICAGLAANSNGEGWTYIANDAVIIADQLLHALYPEGEQE